MNITLEPDALVVLIGAMGTGKSTFCKNNFLPHNIVSSDFIREQLSGDFEDMSQNKAVFEILHATVEARAKAGILTVVDSTGSRSLLEQIPAYAKENNRQLVALKFPHLDKGELTEERMKHRMNYIHAYHRQVQRIDETRIPKAYKVFELPKDGDDVEIKVKGEGDYILSPDDSYVVIPDLHGEYRVVEKALKAYPESKFIFLGDIVDRGESSYKTFRLVSSLIDTGKAFGVRSNHDNKLARYFQKWLSDSSSDKFSARPEGSDLPTYGLKVAWGLQRTLREFYNDLSEEEMLDYAESFVKYYESLPHYLAVEKFTQHYFAHAGVNEAMLRGKVIDKTSEAVAIYKTLKDPDLLSDMIGDPKKRVVVHLGHDYMANEITYLRSSKSPNHIIAKHDIGFGKRKLEDIKKWEFKVV